MGAVWLVVPWWLGAACCEEFVLQGAAACHGWVWRTALSLFLPLQRVPTVLFVAAGLLLHVVSRWPFLECSPTTPV